MIETVVFDLDGVLLQSEEVWDSWRERYEEYTRRGLPTGAPVPNG